MPACEVANQEEAHDTRQTMATDKLPHTLEGALKQEGKHLGIAVGIAQPGGEIDRSNTLGMGLAPPGIVERTGKIDTRKLGEGIKSDGKHDEDERYDEQGLILQADKEGQQHTTNGIEQQDVATPDEHQVTSANEGKDEHATQEARDTMAREEQAKTYAKEQGEDGVKLSIDKHVMEETHHFVDTSRSHLLLFSIRQECPQGKLGEVGQGNTQQRETPQGIENQKTLFFGYRFL